MSAHVVVVGGGIAGLAAAHALRRDGPPGVRLTILEGAGALGGKLRTSSVGGVAVDEGAETFLARLPEAIDLVRAVGLEADLVHPVTTSASIAVDGRLRPLPTGTVMGVPADLDALASSGVLSAAGLARVLDAAAGGGEAVHADVAVGELVRSRLGPEVVERLVDPLLGGVYAGRADVLSLQATMPALAAALSAPLSLVEAAGQARGVMEPGAPVFASLRQGMGALVERLAAVIDADIRLGLPVREVRRIGAGFGISAGPVPAPTLLTADAVVIAAPAAPAARMLRELCPAAASELAAIEYASVAIVTLVYPAGPLPPGSGLLVATSEHRAVKAVTFSSQKWAHLGGEQTVIRASIGRHGEEATLQRDDEDLVAVARREIAGLTGIQAHPVATRVSRWGG
ncbi:MAG: protoporphyrinogen oxidase, partial [Mycobacteriales bacterium]